MATQDSRANIAAQNTNERDKNKIKKEKDTTDKKESETIMENLMTKMV